MAYDSARRALVVFGGFDGDSLLADTWEYQCGTPCYPDLDASGELDVFDFLAFVNLFNEGDAKADCDPTLGLDIFDFLCFVNAFNNGCP